MAILGVPMHYEAAKFTKAERRSFRKRYGTRQCPFILLNGKQCEQSTIYVRAKENPTDYNSTGKLMRTKYCLAHSSDAVLKLIGLSRFGGKTRTSGRGAHPSVQPYKVMRELVEEHVLDFLKPYIDALGAEKEVVVGHGRAAHVVKVPDHRARMQAAEALYDRVYGKPKQTTQLEGGLTFEKVDVPTDKDRELEVAKILAEAGAINPEAAAASVLVKSAKANRN